MGINRPGVSTGGGSVPAGTGPITIGFDYAVGGGPFGLSIFQYQFALVIFDGTNATVQASGPRTLVRNTAGSPISVSARV